MANAATAQSNRRILWGAGTSRTIRAHWALHELSLDYELRPILPRTGETQTPEYTAINPRQKIPALQDGAFIMTESAAIITYLSDRYGTPQNALLPADLVERARCLEWCFFLVSEIDATALYVMRRHVGLPQIYGEAPVAVEAASAYFTRQMGQVERTLADGRTFLMGERFTAPDILLSTCITWAIDYEIPVADSVRAYNERATARPSFKAAVERNRPPSAGKI
jgi:glutathione S-transferase